LNNTWNLISETNYSLRRDIDNYSATDYRTALHKTFYFFKYLDPQKVFSRYKDYPESPTWEKINYFCKINIEIAIKYLAIQLICIGAIEAIAELTGGNAPMSLLMGDIRRRDQQIKRMEDYLEPIETVMTELDSQLIKLLTEGRAQESSFDMKASPIGAYIYKGLGEHEKDILFKVTQSYFDKKINAVTLLENFPQKIISNIIIAISHISSTRNAKLIELNNQLLQNRS